MTLPTPPRAGDLRVEAEKFANDWTNTVRAVVGAHVPPFVPVAKDTAVRAAVVVRQSGNDGIVLTVDSVPVLTLDASAHCIWDHRGSYLAVAESKFKVSAVGLASEPLFRYEFCRTPNRSPMAHLHVHAHRDAVTFVMTRCGGASKRGRRRLLDYDRGTKGNLPVMAHLHFRSAAAASGRAWKTSCRCSPTRSALTASRVSIRRWQTAENSGAACRSRPAFGTAPAQLCRCWRLWAIR